MGLGGMKTEVAGMARAGVRAGALTWMVGGTPGGGGLVVMVGAAGRVAVVFVLVGFALAWVKSISSESESSNPSKASAVGEMSSVVVMDGSSAQIGSQEDQWRPWGNFGGKFVAVGC